MDREQRHAPGYDGNGTPSPGYYGNGNPNHQAGTLNVDVDMAGALESLLPIPALDLTAALYSAVVRSHDEDASASEALERLQNRVLLACARFECATVIV